uniref:Uncharacterized protein n=1 Tax=Chromera velia CCMP2878 TaxID=1169474 RepID=A0A0G4F2S3_9ALVE|eukprot:Cvel_14931.t1-p1 / transcript=Cvel_14931.t1 / gene=Cvel_14931 / organism=Chromera_velia_CCMP2878 / gene_product=hypothetical protein / transcript_product=hypothetical protein / location=Cvel_scaffold1083:6037-13599(+) / protein_length=683 / sequence_SO=supercontig / SO=protein_coding / is_pseudo=false
MTLLVGVCGFLFFVHTSAFVVNGRLRSRRRRASPSSPTQLSGWHGYFANKNVVLPPEVDYKDLEFPGSDDDHYWYMVNINLRYLPEDFWDEIKSVMEDTGNEGKVVDMWVPRYYERSYKGPGGKPLLREKTLTPGIIFVKMRLDKKLWWAMRPMQSFACWVESTVVRKHYVPDYSRDNRKQTLAMDVPIIKGGGPPDVDDVTPEILAKWHAERNKHPDWDGGNVENWERPSYKVLRSASETGELDLRDKHLRDKRKLEDEAKKAEEATGEEPREEERTEEEENAVQGGGLDDIPSPSSMTGLLETIRKGGRRGSVTEVDTMMMQQEQDEDEGEEEAEEEGTERTESATAERSSEFLLEGGERRAAEQEPEKGPWNDPPYNQLDRRPRVIDIDTPPDQRKELKPGQWVRVLKAPEDMQDKVGVIGIVASISNSNAFVDVPVGQGGIYRTTVTLDCNDLEVLDRSQVPESVQSDLLTYCVEHKKVTTISKYMREAMGPQNFRSLSFKKLARANEAWALQDKGYINPPILFSMMPQRCPSADEGWPSDFLPEFRDVLEEVAMKQEERLREHAERLRKEKERAEEKLREAMKKMKEREEGGRTDVGLEEEDDEDDEDETRKRIAIVSDIATEVSSPAFNFFQDVQDELADIPRDEWTRRVDQKRRAAAIASGDQRALEILGKAPTTA